MSSIDFAAIRERVPLVSYCLEHGIELHRAGNLLVGLCPLHDESRPSFTVYPDGRYHCYGCGVRGDVVDLDRSLRGGKIAEAIERLGGSKNVASIARRPTPKRSIYQLSGEDRALINEACKRLEAAPELALRVRPKLPLNAVARAAAQGCLGYCHDLAFGGGIRGPAILFVYPNGIKARWPGKVIRWFVGGPYRKCWRQSSLKRSHRRVYLCEGETDAISLLAVAGLEELGEALVCALSSATCLPDPHSFAGREIIIVPDNDAAGRKCAAGLAHLLKPIATSIRVVRFQG